MLMALTIVALGVAGVMTWLAWRAIREERERSEARVAALAAEIGDGPATPFRAPFAREVAERPPMREMAGEMFSAAARPPRRGARWIATAFSGALVLGVAIATVVGVSLRSHPRQSSTASASATTMAQPLELVSLRHERTAEHLVIKGLVRNPAGGQPVDRVSAVVFLFDREGTFLTSGRALVDFLTLTPGEESPFVVEIPAAGSIGRYRVSFRNAVGNVLPHVDRRSTGGTSDTPAVRPGSAAAARG